MDNTGIDMIVGLTGGLIIGFIMGLFVYYDNHLLLDSCKKQGYYEIKESVIYCSVESVESLIKRDLNK